MSIPAVHMAQEVAAGPFYREAEGVWPVRSQPEREVCLGVHGPECITVEGSLRDRALAAREGAEYACTALGNPPPVYQTRWR